MKRIKAAITGLCLSLEGIIIPCSMACIDQIVTKDYNPSIKEITGFFSGGDISAIEGTLTAFFALALVINFFSMFFVHDSKDRLKKLKIAGGIILVYVIIELFLGGNVLSSIGRIINGVIQKNSPNKVDPFTYSAMEQ